MKIRLWKGYHSEQLHSLMMSTWEQEDLLVVCPPMLQDLSFVSMLPSGPLEFLGTWELDTAAQEAAARMPRQPVTYPSLPVYGVFTSGTVSGTPRLVLYSKRNIESSLDGILKFFDTGRIRAVFSYPQPFHTFGLLLGYQLSLRLGARLLMVPGKYGRAAHEARLAVKEPSTLTLGTPTHFQDLLRFVQETGQVPSPTYSCIMGGAPVSASLWRSVREELRIEAPSIGYGCTEASPGLTHHPPGRMPTEDAEIGFPLEHLELRPLSSGGVEFSGDSLCLAIIHEGRLEFPQRIVVRDDVGIREDGMWLYLGRCDLVLNRGGEKFSLEFLERLIHAHTGLETVCVCVPDPRLGEDLGVLVGVAGGKEERGAVRHLERVLLERAQLRLNPGNMLTVAALPLNAASKLDRRASTELLLRHLGA